MGGEVFLTRRGRLTVTTPLVQAFWKAVWFEETFTAIYMREFEIDVPPRMSQDEEYEPTLNKIMQDLVRVGWDRATRYEEVVNILKPELTACPCCLVNTTKGVTFCVECAKPIPSFIDYYRGMMFSHETGMPIQGRKMGWKVHMERKIRDLHKDVKWRLVTDRLDIMDKKVVAGIIASANPAEDWWLAFRIGASPEAEIIVSQPGVYRLELEDAATHAMILDIELARAIMDVMNYRDRAIDEATGGDVTSFKVMYSHPIMTSIAAARMRFIKYPAGCLRRIGHYLSLQVLASVSGGLNNEPWKKYPGAEAVKKFLLEQIQGTLEIQKEVQQQMKDPEDEYRRKFFRPRYKDRTSLPVQPDIQDCRSTIAAIKNTPGMRMGFNRPNEIAVGHLTSRARRQGVAKIHPDSVARVPMGGMTLGWSAEGPSGAKRVTPNMRWANDNAGYEYPVTGMNTIGDDPSDMLLRHKIHISRSSSREGREPVDEGGSLWIKKEDDEEKVHVFDNTADVDEIGDNANASEACEDVPGTRSRTPVEETDKASESGVSEGRSGRQRPRQGKDVPRVPSAFVRSDDAKSPYIHNLLKEKDGGETSGVEEEVTYTGKGGAGSRPTTTAIRSAATSSASEAPRSDTRRGPTAKSGGRGQEWKVKGEKPKDVKKEY